MIQTSNKEPKINEEKEEGNPVNKYKWMTLSQWQRLKILKNKLRKTNWPQTEKNYEPK